LVNPVPAPPSITKPWQNGLASVVHWALYALIVLAPLTGWLMSSAKNYPVSWFGLFTLPDMVAPDRRLFEVFKKIHGILVFSICMLAGLHIAAALKHHFLDKNNVLRRMLPVKLE
jgi:cytochrome b561